MKNKLVILILFHFFSGTIFCQYHFLESYNDVIVGPENVDIIFSEQVNFYVEEYNSMIFQLEDLQNVHRKKLDKMENRKKKRYREKIQIQQEREALVLIEMEKEIIEEYLFLWKELETGNNEIVFGMVYNDSICYNFFSDAGIFSSKNCKIELDSRVTLEWKEVLPNDDFQEKQRKRIVEYAGKKWIKKRADRNCISKDPKDCMVWCLVETPEEYEVEKYYDGLPDDFQNSIDEGIFFREVAIDNSKEKKYRIFDLSKNIELSLIDFEKVSCD